MSGPRYIYTSITAGKDAVHFTPSDARAVIFSDRDPGLVGWEFRELPKIFSDPRRASRLPKLIPHIFMPDAAYSLYLDGNISLRVPLQRLIDEWLRDADIALFKHDKRNCVFDEARECVRLKLDDEQVIERQMARYAKLPKNAGLYHCGIILRRHTIDVMRLGEAWFAEYCAGSVRDQLALPFALSVESRARVYSIGTFNPSEHPYFYFRGHLVRRSQEARQHG